MTETLPGAAHTYRLCSSVCSVNMRQYPADYMELNFIKFKMLYHVPNSLPETKAFCWKTDLRCRRKVGDDGNKHLTRRNIGYDVSASVHIEISFNVAMW